MHHYIFEIYFFILGLCVGSFLNVCIYRLPASKSIITPRSHCPGCGNTLKIYDNIPVLSYLCLRGKCRFCDKHIPPRYMIVELLTGLFALCVILRFGITLEAAVFFIFIATLIVITFIDIDHLIIPDIISLPGIPLFFLAAVSLTTLSWKDSALGILAGGGSLYLVAQIYYMIRKKIGMGMGDAKLLAMIGAMIGWKGIIFTIYTGSAAGTLAGIAVIIHNRKKDFKTPIPFGPFLVIGAITYIFFGQDIINWYYGITF